jgi:flagellar protein FlaG
MTEISPSDLPLPPARATGRTSPGTAPLPTTQTRVNSTSPDPQSPQSQSVNRDIKSPISLQDTATAVDTIKELVEHMDRNLAFHIDDASGKTVITVLDKRTQEVIRQIPNEEVLSIAQRLREGGGLIGDLIG